MSRATSDPQPEAMREAAEAEAAIANEAAALRGEEIELTAGLFMALYPTLCKPIPAAYIKYVPKLEKGKPYESTGIRSVQVQIDRMNNVLTPLWWWDRTEYMEGGKLAKVTVCIGDAQARIAGEPLLTRTSWGGVDRGSSTGNIYKGSYTNGAKLAFARIGVGHEVYLGAADLDPDVNEEAAAQDASNGQPADATNIGPGIASGLVDRIWKLPKTKGKLQLAASHAAGRDVGDCSTKKKAVEGLVGLTFEQAEKLDNWISRKETEGEVDNG